MRLHKLFMMIMNLLPSLSDEHLDYFSWGLKKKFWIITTTQNPATYLIFFSLDYSSLKMMHSYLALYLGYLDNCCDTWTWLTEKLDYYESNASSSIEILQNKSVLLNFHCKKKNKIYLKTVLSRQFKNVLTDGKEQ